MTGGAVRVVVGLADVRGRRRRTERRGGRSAKKRQVSREHVTLLVRAGKRRHAATAPRLHVKGHGVPRRGVARGVGRRCEPGEDAVQGLRALAAHERPDGLVAVDRVARRTERAEQFASLVLDTGGVVVRCQQVRGHRPDPGGRVEHAGRVDGIHGETVGAETRDELGRRRRHAVRQGQAERVDEHVLADDPRLPQILADPFGAAHRDKPQRHHRRRERPAVGAAAGRPEQDRQGREHNGGDNHPPGGALGDGISGRHARAEDRREQAEEAAVPGAEDLGHRDASPGRRAQIPHERERNGDGHRQHPSPRGVARDAGLERGVGKPRGGPDGEQARQAHRHERAREERRPVRFVEEAVPEPPGQYPLARRQHVGEDAVDDHEAEPRRRHVDPPDGHVHPGRQPIPAVVVHHRGRDLDEEERPLNRPSPHERVDERGGGLGMHQADGEPDPDTGDGAEHEREQNEEAAEPLRVVEQRGVAVAAGPALDQDEIEAAAHREMRDEHVKDGDDGDEQAARGDVPDRVVHRSGVESLQSCASATTGTSGRPENRACHLSDRFVSVGPQYVNSRMS